MVKWNPCEIVNPFFVSRVSRRQFFNLPYIHKSLRDEKPAWDTKAC